MWKKVAYYCASCCGITIVCVTADWLVFRSDAFQKYPLLRAVTDNLTHGLVGCWCWATSAIFVGWNKYTLYECLLCFSVACAVDVDHFIEARSLSFKVSVVRCTRAFQGLVAAAFSGERGALGHQCVFRSNATLRSNTTFRPIDLAII